MGNAVAIARKEFSECELRALAAETDDGAVVRRLLAIALILEGYSRSGTA